MTAGPPELCWHQPRGSCNKVCFPWLYTCYKHATKETLEVLRAVVDYPFRDKLIKEYKEGKRP